MPFSRPREKRKSLSFNGLGSIFHRFFHEFLKNFRVPLVPCPNLVPGLSHAASRTQKLLKKGCLALVFDSVPLILQTKIIFGVVCGLFRGRSWPESGPFVIQTAYKWGRSRPFCNPYTDQERKAVPTKFVRKHEQNNQVSRKARKGLKAKAKPGR
jgi:hypothetical protein